MNIEEQMNDQDENMEAINDIIDEKGIESEDVGISNPFDPSKIKVETKQMSLDTLITRMKEGEINLAPDFQRNEVWKPRARSQLIESLLIRIPLPAFYMDATDENKWVVVDGLQRLSTLRNFIIPEDEQSRLRLVDLEFLTDMNGKGFSDLPRYYQRRITETQVTVYLIEKGTQDDVKFNIFKRINTGGLPLSSQEIRHALNQGPAANLLKRLAESELFQKVTTRSMRDQRMSDRECVLRFFAFVLTPYSEYGGGDFDAFLSDAMAKINKMSEQERQQIAARFDRAMLNAHAIFLDRAFRKQTIRQQGRHPINKALFEVWSVTLDALTDAQIDWLTTYKDAVNQSFKILIDSDQEFVNAITQGTGHSNRVHKRFKVIEELIQEILGCGDLL
ncbi:MAG: DUF262 domain-containing protein [Magnetococcus sp. YQC-3]